MDQANGLNSAADGRRLRALTVVDNYTRESLAIDVGQSLKGEAKHLNRLLLRSVASGHANPYRGAKRNEYVVQELFSESKRPISTVTCPTHDKRYVRAEAKYSEAQKNAAIEHYVNHGRCIAFTRQVLGYPSRQKLSEWVGERYPETRKCIVRNMGNQSKKTSASPVGHFYVNINTEQLICLLQEAVKQAKERSNGKNVRD